MKIGILTLPLEFNYGGILQAFALQTVLKSLGHEVYTIDRHDYNKYKSLTHHVKGYIHRLILRVLYKKNVSIQWNPYMTQEEKDIVGANIKPFINKHITLTDFVFSNEFKVR